MKIIGKIEFITQINIGNILANGYDINITAFDINNNWAYRTIHLDSIYEMVSKIFTGATDKIKDNIDLGLNKWRALFIHGMVSEIREAMNLIEIERKAGDPDFKVSGTYQVLDELATLTNNQDAWLEKYELLITISQSSVGFFDGLKIYFTCVGFGAIGGPWGMAIGSIVGIIEVQVAIDADKAAADRADKDKDGLNAKTEREHNSSDNNPDSDSDGVSDFIEYRLKTKHKLNYRLNRVEGIDTYYNVPAKTPSSEYITYYNDRHRAILVITIDTMILMLKRTVQSYKTFYLQLNPIGYVYDPTDSKNDEKTGAIRDAECHVANSISSVAKIKDMTFLLSFIVWGTGVLNMLTLPEITAELGLLIHDVTLALDLGKQLHDIATTASSLSHVAINQLLSEAEKKCQDKQSAYDNILRDLLCWWTSGSRPTSWSAVLSENSNHNLFDSIASEYALLIITDKDYENCGDLIKVERLLHDTSKTKEQIKKPLSDVKNKIESQSVSDWYTKVKGIKYGTTDKNILQLYEEAFNENTKYPKQKTHLINVIHSLDNFIAWDKKINCGIYKTRLAFLASL